MLGVKQRLDDARFTAVVLAVDECDGPDRNPLCALEGFEIAQQQVSDLTKGDGSFFGHF